MNEQPGFFNDRNDVVLKEFLLDRRRLLRKMSACLLIAGGVMTCVGVWEALVIVLLILGTYWREYILMAKRARAGTFGEGENDYDLLDQYLSARGARIKNMSLN